MPLVGRRPIMPRWVQDRLRSYWNVYPDSPEDAVTQGHLFPESTCHVPSGPMSAWTVTEPERRVAPAVSEATTRQPSTGMSETPPCVAKHATAPVGVA